LKGAASNDGSCEGTKESGDEDTDSNDDQPKRKKVRVMSETDAIDTNECCVYFATYEGDVQEENGRTWIECGCGRWLHEDCSFPVSLAMHNEFCLYCVRWIFFVCCPPLFCLLLSKMRCSNNLRSE